MEMLFVRRGTIYDASSIRCDILQICSDNTLNKYCSFKKSFFECSQDTNDTLIRFMYFGYFPFLTMLIDFIEKNLINYIYLKCRYNV